MTHRATRKTGQGRHKPAPARLRRACLHRNRLHRIATLLAILLLTLRVGTEAAVGCQHVVAESLARAAQTAQAAQAGAASASDRSLSIAQLARGALCSTAYSQAGATGAAGPFDPVRSDAAAKHHQLAKSCPVFSAPAVLPQAIVAAEAIPQVYSGNLILPEPWRATSKVARRAYHPRGPPVSMRMLG